MALVLPGLAVAPKTFRCAASKSSPVAPSKYPDLSEDWLGLWNAFRSLSPVTPTAEPAASLASEPQGVLSWLEWWHWRRRIETDTEPRFAAGPDLNLTLATAAQSGAWRSVRCALLGSDIEDLDEALIAQLDELLSACSGGGANELLAAEGLDRAVSWALLLQGRKARSRIPLPALAETVERTILAALARRDIFAPGPLLAFAGALVGEDLYAQARRLVEDAASLTLPYGFISGATASEQRRCLAADCYRPQIELSERLRRIDGPGL